MLDPIVANAVLDAGKEVYKAVTRPGDTVESLIKEYDEKEPETIGSIFGVGAKYREQRMHALVRALLQHNIDPMVFDRLMSFEQDRYLKRRFGYAFLLLTTIFTAGSYLIVVFDGVFDWGISDIAITALIIETPIQFIGLLYIIARNLFPTFGELPLLDAKGTKPPPTDTPKPEG